MTEKFDKFKAALEKLCDDYGVTIDTGYDGVVVYMNPMNPSDKPSEHDMWLQDATNWWEISERGK